MYRILVEAEAFRGKNKVQQQKMVTREIQSEIAGWHGFTLVTRVPETPSG